MVSDLNFCPDCGAKIAPEDRFCGECGFDISTLEAPSHDDAAASHSQQAAAPIEPVQLAAPPPRPAQPANQVGTAPVPPPRPSADTIRPDPLQHTGMGNTNALGRGSSGSKGGLIIILAVLVLALGGGLIFWLASRGEDPGKAAPPTAAQQKGARPDETQPTAPAPTVAEPATAQADLTRAATYLSNPGLKCTAFVNYPDGTAGIVERTSALVVPAEAVRVSEVETGVEQGEAFGYGFHYVERADGTYYILDEAPYQIYPVLKNDLSVGRTWDYQDEFGKVVWTVIDMGVDLNLGFAVFKDCLLVKEDNQAVQYQSISYYAPGRGIVLVIDPGGSTEYYKLTAITHIDLTQAADTVIKWSPNYKDINDDRTQSY